MLWGTSSSWLLSWVASPIGLMWSSSSSLCPLETRPIFQEHANFFTSAFSNGQQTGQPVCIIMLQASWKAWPHAILITIVASSSSGVIWQSWESQATWGSGSFPGYLKPSGIDLLSICKFNAAKWYCVHPYSLSLVSRFLGSLTDSPACNPTFSNSFINNKASPDKPTVWVSKTSNYLESIILYNLYHIHTMLILNYSW